ncbi:MAG: hypothetical protein U1F43_26295 [Myxococcota bacterium]
MRNTLFCLLVLLAGCDIDSTHSTIAERIATQEAHVPTATALQGIICIHLADSVATYALDYTLGVDDELLHLGDVDTAKPTSCADGRPSTGYLLGNELVDVHACIVELEALPVAFHPDNYVGQWSLALDRALVACSTPEVAR